MRTVCFMAVMGFLTAGSLATPAVAQSGGKAKAKVSAEMRDFMKHLDGRAKNVDAALKKYAAKGVDTSAMDGIEVREPKITKTETKEGMTCYTMSCKTGILDRVYLIGWKDKKIQQLKQLSVK